MCGASRKLNKDAGPDIVLSLRRTMGAFKARGTQMAIQLFRCAPAGNSKARQGDVNGGLSDSTAEKNARCAADVIYDPGSKIFPTLYFHVLSLQSSTSTLRHASAFIWRTWLWNGRHSLPIIKPIRLTVFYLTWQVNSVHDLFQITYAKFSKQATCLRVFLLISCLFHACYTSGQSSIFICAPR